MFIKYLYLHSYIKIDQFIAYLPWVERWSSEDGEDKNAELLRYEDVGVDGAATNVPTVATGTTVPPCVLRIFIVSFKNYLRFFNRTDGMVMYDIFI